MTYPDWANREGVPTTHAVRAALHVASLVGHRGARVTDIRESYRHHATGGAFPPPDLELGERLLLDLGLVTEIAGVLEPSPAFLSILEGTAEDAIDSICLRAIEQVLQHQSETPVGALHDREAGIAVLIPDAARRERLLIALARRFDNAQHKLIGEIGEEVVLAAARSELEALGYEQLARAVRRVSVDSDQLGYDISAPRISGPPRLLEVKSTTINRLDNITIHLTRTEADVGAKYSDWALVICRVTDVAKRVGEILGWCSANRVNDLLPIDKVGGTWEQAAITLPTDYLVPGLPRLSN